MKKLIEETKSINLDLSEIEVIYELFFLRLKNIEEMMLSSKCDEEKFNILINNWIKLQSIKAKIDIA